MLKSRFVGMTLAGTLTFALALPLQAQVVERTTVASVAGCYALTTGPWSTQITWDGYALPGVIRLDTIFRSHGMGGNPPDSTSWYSLLPKTTHPGGQPTLSRWGIIAPDSLKVYWYPSRSGDVLLLRVRGDTLRGTVTAYSDVMSDKPKPTAHVTGVRTTCPENLR